MIICMIWLVFGFQQESSSLSLEDLQRQVIALQDRLPKKPITQDDLAYFKKDLQNNAKEYGLRQERQLNEVQFQLAEVKAKNFWLNALLSLGGFTILGLFLYSWKGIKAVEKRHQAKIEALFRNKADHISTLIAGEVERAAIMTDDPILVLGHPGQDQITGLLRQSGFKVERWNQETLAVMNPSGFKLFAFENLDEAAIQACIAKLPPQEVYVAYWTGSRRLDVSEKVTCANSPMTLYARLMEAARYRRLRLPEQGG